jgi:Mg-chelatase subunit ChlI
MSTSFHLFIKQGGKKGKENYDRERVRRLRDDRRRRRSSSESEDDDEESLPDEESVSESESDPEEEESESESESESELSTSCCWAMIDLGAFYTIKNKKSSSASSTQSRGRYKGLTKQL